MIWLIVAATVLLGLLIAAGWLGFALLTEAGEILAQDEEPRDECR